MFSKIIAIAKSYKVDFLEVKIDMKNNIPNGSATATLKSGSVLEDAISKLNGMDFKGRPIRVIPYAASKKKSRLSESNRYYSEERIDIKCNSCGKVGHISDDCEYPPLVNPCHLCAGIDHEAGMLKY